jgi:hypothetical protein
MNDEQASGEIKEEFELRTAAKMLLKQLDAPHQVVYAGSGGGYFQGNPAFKRAWADLHQEIHGLICTRSKKYSTDRHHMAALGRSSILFFGGLIATKFGIGATTAMSLATLALAMPMRMGRNAWCRAYKEHLSSPKTPEGFGIHGLYYLPGERDQLVEIAGLSTSDPGLRRFSSPS